MSEPFIPASRLVCVYAEPLARGKRVLVVGEARGIGGWLMDLGARLVHVYDPVDDDSMQPTPPRGVTVYRLSQSDFDVRDGAFDLAIVPDLGNIPDPAAIVARLRRIVGQDGALVVSARNPDGGLADAARRSIDYYELYDLLALQFAAVRMVAQVPFTGVALAELGEADPEVTIHTDLAPDPPPPDHFIAVASQRDLRLDPYTIVQTPPPRTGWLTAPAPAPNPEEWADRAMLAETTLRADLLEAQLEEQTKSLRDLESRAADALGLAERLAQEVPRAQSEAQRYAEQAARLDVALRVAKEALGDFEDRAAGAEARAAELERHALLAESGLRQRNEERDGLVHELQIMRAELVRAKDIDSEELARVVAHAIQHEARANALESELARANEAKSRASALESELARANEAQARVHDAQLRASDAQARADALEAELARATHAYGVLESELARASRTYGLLESELAQVSEAHGAELARFEAVLRERARVLADLERELRRREQMVHELLGAMEESASSTPAIAEAIHVLTDAAHVAPPAPPVAAPAPVAPAPDVSALTDRIDQLAEENAVLRSKLDALALEVARREGELQSRTWRIDELEAELARLGDQLAARDELAAREPPPGDREARPADTGPEIATLIARAERAEEELDFLRKALAQEHDARVKSQAADAGQELVTARAELQRQAVLIEQLSGELEAKDRAAMAFGARES